MNLRGGTPAVVALTAGALLLSVAPARRVAAESPPQNPAAAVRQIEEAVKLIGENRLREALQALNRAIAANDEYWEAHYQRGRVLGLLDRWQESRDALLRATELNPGHGHAHRLASIAATNVEDWDSAWDQAIKAQLAGEDMRDAFLQMYHLAPPPDDFGIRINAATVFVADVDSSVALADIELPTNFNPQAPASAGARSGRGAQLEDSAVNQSTLDLIRLQRSMRGSLAESPRLAVVLDPGRAKYILAISITDISAQEPRSASGYFRLIDIASREVIYRSNIDFADISATTAIAGKLRRYVTDLTAWLEKRETR